jgi:hypothetical protein
VYAQDAHIQALFPLFSGLHARGLMSARARARARALTTMHTPMHGQTYSKYLRPPPFIQLHTLSLSPSLSHPPSFSLLPPLSRFTFLSRILVTHLPIIS